MKFSAVAARVRMYAALADAAAYGSAEYAIFDALFALAVAYALRAAPEKQAA